MTLPKRLSEVLEENKPAFRMPEIVASLGPIRFKTGGLAPGIIVEALVNDERVAHLVATKEASGNYIIDDVHVEPEYRNNGVATALLRTAHETVPMVPYALTNDQVYRSEAGRRLALKELRIHTAGPLAAIPEIAAAVGEAAGGAAAAGEAAGAAGEAAAGAGEAASSMPKIKVPSFSGHSTQSDDDDNSQGTTAANNGGQARLLHNLVGEDYRNLHEVSKKMGMHPDDVRDFIERYKDERNSSGTTWEVHQASAIDVVPHLLSNMTHWVGLDNVSHGLNSIVRGADRPDIYQGISDNGAPMYGPSAGTMADRLAEIGINSAAGYGAWRARKGIGNAVRGVGKAIEHAPILHKETRGQVPVVEKGRELKEKATQGLLGLGQDTAQHGPKGRRSNVNLEMGIMEGLQQITQMLKCLCGKECSSQFNGMPHCMPGQGCCSNAMHGSDSCGSCGNPEAAGSFHNMPLCAPGQGCNEDHKSSGDNLLGLIKSMGCKCGAGCKLGQGCTKSWAPTDETPNEKIQDHDDWASQTNHGQFDMPGPKKPLPPTTWE